MAGQTLWDQLLAGAGDAITDIRQKLVEEPWYGRTLDVPTVELNPAAHERGHPELEKTPEPSGPNESQDRGIER